MTKSTREKQFGDGSKLVFKDHFEALEGLRNPTNPHQSSSDRHYMMDVIHAYLDASYFIGINGVRQLRGILPQYNWEYVEVRSIYHFERVVQSVDFLWVMMWNNMPTGLVEFGAKAPVQATFEMPKPVAWTTKEYEQVFAKWAKADPDVNVMKLVSAARKITRPQPLSFVFCRDHNASEGAHEEVEFVQHLGGKPIYSTILNK